MSIRLKPIAAVSSLSLSLSLPLDSVVDIAFRPLLPLPPRSLSLSLRPIDDATKTAERDIYGWIGKEIFAEIGEKRFFDSITIPFARETAKGVAAVWRLGRELLSALHMDGIAALQVATA